MNPTKTAESFLPKPDKSNFNLKSTGFKSKIVEFDSMILQSGAVRTLSIIPRARASAKKISLVTSS